MSRTGSAAVRVCSVMADLFEDGFDGQGIVCNRSGDQALESRTISAREVGDVAAVDLEEHLRAGVPHLSGNPLGVFARGKPQRGGRVPRLIGSSLLQPQMTQ